MITTGNWRSRESKFFNGGLAPRNGVVLESFWDSDEEIASIVADFTNHAYVFVLRSCFQNTISPETKSQLQKDLRPYNVFEAVQFECNQYNVVKQKISRFIKRHEVVNLGHSILAASISLKQYFPLLSSSPDTDESQIKCYTDIAGMVPCSRAHYGRNIVRNVPCVCWLRFNYRPGMFSRRVSEKVDVMEIKYTLYSVVGVDSDNLEFAYSAPWNRHLKVPMYQNFDEFVDPAEKQDRKYINQLAFYLHNQLVYIPRLPKIPIRFAWIQYIGILREQSTTIVSTKAMNLDVRYHALAKSFIAYDPAQTAKSDLNVKYCFSSDLNHHFIATLQSIPSCPGFFFIVGPGPDKNRDDIFRQGIVHDPYAIYRNRYTCVTEYIDRAVIKYRDPDPYSYTPLYVCSTPGIAVNYNDLLGRNVAAFCYDIGSEDALFYSPPLHDCEIRMKMELDPESVLKLGMVCNVIMAEVRLDTYPPIIYVHPTAILDQVKVDLRNPKTPLPTILVFSEICGAIGLPEPAINKIPRLNNEFYAIVQFRKILDNYQLRPYVVRVAREFEAKNFIILK
ncbi:hypothetical protein FO519_001827 [Halicephalobus sp. NKZ332]|nr:hypothetical protein FO519_001827 [Halicephalobus sp. NKZ332]